MWGEVGVERAVCVGRWGLKEQCVVEVGGGVERAGVCVWGGGGRC